MVIDSIADHNMNNGMYFPEVFATVVNSTARNNGYGGIFFDNYLESAINNVANKNGSVGIEISTGEANSLVSGNTANRNHVGIALPACDSDVFGNTALGNLGGNLVTSGSPANSCLLLDNTAP
jgi:parallel beta-helix repeat protein